MQTIAARWRAGNGAVASAAAALLALPGCAVDSPFAISSTSLGTPARLAITMTTASADEPERARLGHALRRAFGEGSASLANDGRYLADYSVSWRDAEGGLTASVDAADAAAIEWQVRPRRPRLIDGCDAQRMRATLVLLDRQTGTMAYRGEGDATGCRFTDQSIDEVADALVADALQQLGG